MTYLRIRNNSQHKNCITSVLMALLLCLVLWACEEDKTCDERTDSTVIIALNHITATDSVNLTQTAFNKVTIYRQSEEKAILVGSQVKKTTLYSKGLATTIEKTTPLDTVTLTPFSFDSIRLEGYQENKYLFKYALIQNVFQHEDVMDSVIITGQGLDSIIFNSKTADGGHPTLPLDLNADSTTFSFSMGGQKDEIKLLHSMSTEMLSPTCGFAMNFILKSGRHSTHIIDSISIINKDVTPQSTNIHIAIYF